MALTSGFYNSVNHDRVYDALQVSQLFDGLISDGIFMNYMKHFQVKPSSGLTVTVGAGRAWFNHIWVYNDSDMFKTLSEPSLTSDRIDAIVIKIDKTLPVRNAAIEIIEGQPGNPARKPDVISEGDIHRYPLAYVTIHKQATSITDADIESVIGTSATPFVSAIVQTLTIDEWMARFQDEFNIWFDHMKDQLDHDAAGHLQTEIDTITAKQTSMEEDISEVNSSISAVQTDITNINTRILNATGRRQVNITDVLAAHPTWLSDAVTDLNLEKYGFKIGDYFIGPASGYTYFLAGYNTNRAWNDWNGVLYDHITIVVNTHTETAWGTEYRYQTSTLRTFLTTTALDNIRSDFTQLFGDSDHIYRNVIISSNGALGGSPDYNRDYIGALTTAQINAPMFSVSAPRSTDDAHYYGMHIGEAKRPLELFIRYCLADIFSVDDSSYASGKRVETVHMRDLIQISNNGEYGCKGITGDASYFSLTSAAGIGSTYVAVGYILFH